MIEINSLSIYTRIWLPSSSGSTALSFKYVSKKSAKSPFLADNSLKVPDSETDPSLRTIMRSHCDRNVILCVTKIRVWKWNLDSKVQNNKKKRREKKRLTLCLSNPLGPITCSNICLPTWESTALNGSSNK